MDLEEKPTRLGRRAGGAARSRKRALLVRLSALGTVALFVWGLFFSPLLDVKKVRVVGAAETEVDDVIDAADVEGQNLLLVSTGGIADRIEKLPWVRTVEIDRILPGTIRVKVSERAPAVVLSVGAARWTIDRTGRVLAAGERRSALPIIAGMSIGEVRPGERLRGRETGAALRVFRSLAPPVRRVLQVIFAPSVERISLTLKDGTQVRYGAAERLAAKNRVLVNLLTRLRREGSPPSYIDVRVPTSPAVATVPALDALVSPTPTPLPSASTSSIPSPTPTP